MLVVMAGCSADGEKKLARSLYDQAQEAVDAADYSSAVKLIDSLKNTYPHQVEVRRLAMHLSARAAEGLALKRLESADSLLAHLTAETDAIKDSIKVVENPIENYYVAATADAAKFPGTDGLQARLTPDGQLYLISSLGSRKVNSKAIAVESEGQRAVTATVEHDGERNDRSMGAEIITFMGAECEAVTDFIAAHQDSPVKLIFLGDNDYSMQLPAKQVKEIALVTRYASLLRQGRAALLEKEKQQRILDTARTQAARTFSEEE